MDKETQEPGRKSCPSLSKALKVYSKNCQPPSAEEKALEMERTMMSVSKATKITQESEEMPMCRFIVQGEKLSQVSPTDSSKATRADCAEDEEMPGESEASMETQEDQGADALEESVLSEDGDVPTEPSEKNLPPIPPSAKKEGIYHTLSFTTKEIRERKPELMEYIQVICFFTQTFSVYFLL